MDTDVKNPWKGRKAKHIKTQTGNSDANVNRRLIPKDAICQLLAESVHSYSYTCKIIAEYNFQGGRSVFVPEVFHETLNCLDLQ